MVHVPGVVVDAGVVVEAVEVLNGVVPGVVLGPVPEIGEVVV